MNLKRPLRATDWPVALGECVPIFRPVSWGCVLLWTLVLCDPATAQHPTVRTDTLPGGVIRVQNTGDGIWNEATRWRLEEEFRLGKLEGGGPDQFGNLLDFGVDASRRLFVLDAFDREVRVFDSAGAYLLTIGGRGGGPGEFETPHGISVTPDGHLWVVDPSNARYSLFDPSGAYETGYPYPVSSVILPNPNGFTLPWGYVDWTIEREAAGSDGYWTNHTPRVFRPPNQYDSLPPLRVWTEFSSDGRQKPGAGRLLYHLSQTGDLWFAPDPNEYTLYRRSLDGDTTLIVTLDAAPVSWTDAQRDSLLETQRGRGRSSLRLSDIPQVRPIVRKIFSDLDGHLFVIPQRSGAPDGNALDVFEGSGRYLGRLPLPEPILFRITSPVVVMDHLYAVVADEFDVAYLVSWGILRGDRPRS